MFVKKFEADTLEEALQAVKSDLGPDAIILKTITNKGLKGAFKKKRIEITAAISERNFEKKAKVDKVLNDDQKQSFYQNSAETMKNTINEYGQKTQATSSGGGYGSMGLNKVVNTLAKGGASIADATTKTTSILKNSLDDFLNTEAQSGMDDFINDAFEDEEQPAPRVSQRAAPANNPQRGRYAEPPEPFRTPVEPVRPAAPQRQAPQQARYAEDERVSTPQAAGVSKEAYQELKHEFRTQQNKIELLEKKLAELTQNYHFNQKLMSEAQGVFQLRTTLKSLGIDEGLIIELIKKASYELTKEGCCF
jgi:flagellar biosynthesis protein FlhF